MLHGRCAIVISEGPGEALRSELLTGIDRVVSAAMPCADGLHAHDVMVIGATARDLHHMTQGHRFAAAATHDLDLALALRSWGAFERLVASFEPVGDSDIRFRIANTIVDLVPFGDVEDPRGVVTPPPRPHPMGVWALSEVFAGATQLSLPSEMHIRIPTIAGYSALKLGAWLDRSGWHQTKDARDIALALYWYAKDPDVETRMYETAEGQDAYLAE